MYRALNSAGLANFTWASFPSSIVASDFSGILVVALLIVGSISLVCLVAGYVTTILLIGRKERGAMVGCTLFFAGAWFAIGWFVAEAFVW